jgi:hypothetical protein
MAMLLANVTFGGAPLALPARAKLVRTSVSSDKLFVTKISEKDIVAECASDNAKDPKDLKFMLVGESFYVVDMVTTNLLCPFLYIGSGCITQAAAVAYSGIGSNIVHVMVVDSVTAPTNGLLEADLGGSIVYSESLVTVSNQPSKVTMSMTLQAGSHSNHCVYTGTIKTSGKPISFPP